MRKAGPHVDEKRIARFEKKIGHRLPERRHDTEWYRTRQFKCVASSFDEFVAALKSKA